jgi:hypothetical protein
MSVTIRYVNYKTVLQAPVTVVMFASGGKHSW